jgi:hypothetical protein
MNNNLNLKRRIMARIYLEYTKNVFWEYPDYFMFALFLVTSFMLVSFHDVLINMPKDSFPHLFDFSVVAVRNTSLVLQVLIAGFFVRVIVGGTMLAYKNFGDKLPLIKLIKLRY